MDRIIRVKDVPEGYTVDGCEVYDLNIPCHSLEEHKSKECLTEDITDKIKKVMEWLDEKTAHHDEMMGKHNKMKEDDLATQHESDFWKYYWMRHKLQEIFSQLDRALLNQEQEQERE